MSAGVVKDTISNYVVFGGQIVIGFLAIPVYISVYGESLYGAYLLSIGIASALMVLEFGSSKAMLRYAAELIVDEDAGKYSEAVRVCLVLTAVAVLLLSLGLVGVAEFQDFIFNIDPEYARESRLLFLWSAVYGAIVVVGQLPKSMLNGAGIFHRRNKYMALEFAARGLVLAAIWYTKASIFWLLAAEIGLACLSNGLDLFVISRSAPQLLRLDDGAWPGWAQLRASTSFDYAKSTFYLSLLGFVSQTADRLLIGVFLELRFVTIYAILIKPYMIIKNLTNKLINVLVPYYVRVPKVHGRDAAIDFTVRTGLAMNTVFAFGTLVVLVLLPSFYRVWLGTDEYDPYVVYGQLLVGAYALKTITSVTSGILFMNGETESLIRIDAVSVTINVIASILLVQFVGVGGILIGTFLPLLLSVPYVIVLSTSYFRLGTDVYRSGHLLNPLFSRFLMNTAVVAAALAASVYIEQAFPYAIYGVNAVAVAVATVVAAAAVVFVRRPVTDTVARLKTL